MEEEKSINLKEMNIESLKSLSFFDLSNFIDSQHDNQKLIMSKKILNRFLEFIKEIIDEPYKYLSWKKIKDEFFLDKNIMRRFSLLSALPTEKGVCENRACPIFPHLQEVALELDKLKFYTVEEAKEHYGKDSMDYKTIKEKIKELNRILTRTLEETYSLFVVQNTGKTFKREAHIRSIEKIKVMAECNVPYSKSVGAEVDADYDEDEAMLMPNDPRLKEKHNIFQEG